MLPPIHVPPPRRSGSRGSAQPRWAGLARALPSLAQKAPRLAALVPGPAWPACTASRVDGSVFISGYLAAADPGLVRALGVTRIIKLFADDPSYAGGAHRHAGVEYLVFDADDDPCFDIGRTFAPALRFLGDALGRGERVLVHCHAGVSRSATIVLLYLMAFRGLRLEAALRHLRRARPVVRPNRGFMRALEAADLRLGRRPGRSTA